MAATNALALSTRERILTQMERASAFVAANWNRDVMIGVEAGLFPMHLSLLVALAVH